MKKTLMIGAALAALMTAAPLAGAANSGQTIMVAQASQQVTETSREAVRKARRLERQKKRRAERARKKEERAAARKKKKAERAAAKKKAARNAEAKPVEETKPVKKKVKTKPKKKASNKPASDDTAKKAKRKQRMERLKAEEKAAAEKRRRDEAKAKRKADRKAARAATADGSDPTKTPASVVKRNLSRSERENLRAAERERRAERRQNRRQIMGVFAAGAVVGVVVNELGGRVVEDQGDRIIVERGGRYYVRKDENDLFRRGGARVRDEVLPNGDLRTTILRRDGSKVITVRDRGGYLIRRVRVMPNGNQFVLINSEADRRLERRRERRDFRRELGAVRLQIARRDYIVESRRADRRALRRALAAAPVERVERAYSLEEVRGSDRLREKVRRVDLDSITFASGSFSVTEDQVDALEYTANAMQEIVAANPREIFLIEGHTDAVGSEVSNLTLSDRRAETIARILTSTFNLPPENLVVQGYGEEFLKINTLGSEPLNRRVTIRRITPLLQTASN